MICKCVGCGTRFEATGLHAFEVLTGGKNCPQCGKEYGIKLIEVSMNKKKR